MSDRDQAPRDLFGDVARRAGRAARASTEELPVTAGAVHQHRRRSARLGVATGTAVLVAAVAIGSVVLDRAPDRGAPPAGLVPATRTSTTEPQPDPEVFPRALAAAGISAAPPAGWRLVVDGPLVATFRLDVDGRRVLTAQAFVPGSAVGADLSTLGPVPDDLVAWAAQRPDVEVVQHGVRRTDIGSLQWVDLEVADTTAPLLCPEQPGSAQCSVLAPDRTRLAGLDLFRDDAGPTMAIVYRLAAGVSPEEYGPDEFNLSFRR